MTDEIDNPIDIMEKYIIDIFGVKALEPFREGLSWARDYCNEEVNGPDNEQ